MKASHGLIWLFKTDLRSHILQEKRILSQEVPLEVQIGVLA